MAISPQKAEFNREFTEQKKFTFDLLSDPGNQTAKAYGLVYTLPEDLRKIYLQFGLDVPKHNGDDSWTLPLPARYIIDRKGIVRYAEVSADYTVRPEPESTVAALREFNREFTEQKKFTFDLLSDPGNQTAKAYGLVYSMPQDLRKIYLQFGIDVPKHNGDDSWSLPMPARYIIDQTGIIRYAAVDADYTVRPEPESTIAALKEL